MASTDRQLTQTRDSSTQESRSGRRRGALGRTLQHSKLLTEGEVSDYKVNHALAAEAEQREQTLHDPRGNEDYHHEPRKPPPTGRTEFVQARGTFGC